MDTESKIVPYEERVRKLRAERKAKAPAVARQESPFKDVFREKPREEAAKSESESEQQKSIGGFVENVVEDFASIPEQIWGGVAGISTILFKSVTQPEKALEKVGGWIAHPLDTGEAFIRLMTEDIDFYKRPISSVSTVLALASGGGALMKGTGKAFAAAGAKELGKRMAVAGEKILQKSISIDPVVLTGKAAFKVAPRVLEAFGVDQKYTRNMMREKRVEWGLAGTAAAETKAKILTQGLSEIDKQAIWKAMAGAPEDISALSPAAKQRLDRWTEWIGEKGGKAGIEEEAIRRGLLTEEQAMRANAKFAAMVHGIPEEQALANIKSGAWKPVYHTLFRLESEADDLFDLLNSRMRTSSKIGRYEARLGKGKYEVDPDVFMARQIDLHYMTQAKLNWLDKTLDMVQKGGDLRYIRKLEDLKAVPQGYAIIQPDFIKKYLDSGRRASSYAWRFQSEGKTIEEALELAYSKTMKELIDEARVGGEAVQVAVPRSVAAYIDREFALPNWYTRLHDKGLDFLRAGYTLFNPRFWGGQAIGNGFLSALFGVGIKDVKLARKLKESLPGAFFRGVVQTDVRPPGTGFLARATQTLGEFSAALDNLFRRPIFVKAVERSRQALLKTGSAFFRMNEVIVGDQELFLKAVSGSVADYSDTLHKIQITSEQLSAQTPELRAIKSRYTEAAAVAERRKAIWEQASKELSDAERRLIGGHAIKRIVSDISEAEKKIKGLEETIKRTEAQVGKIRELSKTRPSARGFGGEKTIRKTPTGEILRTETPLEAVGKYPEAYIREAEEKLASLRAELEKTHVLRKELIEEGDLLKRISAERDAALQRRKVAFDEFDIARNRASYLESQLKTREADFRKLLEDKGQLDLRAEALKPYYDYANKAMDVTNQFTGEYVALHPVERNIFRRIVSFYAWMSTMTKLIARLPFQRPKTVLLLSRMQKVYSDMMEDDEMPEYMKGYVPAMAHDDGSITFMRWESFNPMASAARLSKVGGVKVPSILDIAEQNPFLRLYFEMKGGVNTWTKRPYSPGDLGVRIGSGEVYEYDSKSNKWGKTIAQPTLWRSLWGMTPDAQYIDTIFLDHVQTDRGWLLQPDPVPGPDGKPRFPREFMERLLSVVVPLRRAVPEELKQRQRSLDIRIIREMQRKIRTMTPEDQAAAREVLRDYWRGQERFRNRNK